MNMEQQTEKDESTLIILAKALLGAILGSIPAVILWVVLGKVGVLAAVAGFFMMAGELIACGYFTRKSRNMNIQTAIVICSVVMLVNVYLCERLLWSWELSDLLNSEEYSVTIIDCFTNFGSLTEAFEIQEDFTASLVQSYLFAIIGAVAGCMKLARK